MDVVKRNIERLRGKVDIRSRAGVGLRPSDVIALDDDDFGKF
jgi:hypothetical protein